MKLTRFLPKGLTRALICTILLATFLPCPPSYAASLGIVTNIAITVLFFLHGAKLSREAIIAGVSHWRLHLLIFASTFLLFPLLSILFKPILLPLLTPTLYTGIIYLTALPSTAQASVAFTAIARGNVPAAICSASASSLLGVILTPALVGLLLASHGSMSGWATIWGIVKLLLLPFIAGQLLRAWLLPWLERHQSMTKIVDQGSILLLVYSAFSEAVDQGIWHQISVSLLLKLILAAIVLLACAMLVTSLVGRWLGFNRADQITLIFCGSKKSLIAGVPMASAIFAGHSLGMVLLPLMIFHQVQLMVCASLSSRWGRRKEE